MTGAAATRPTLSVCIPAYNRPALFRTALSSVVAQVGPLGARVELVVSDDSTDDATGEVCRRQLGPGGGIVRYHHNAPPLGMAANWNRCVELAQGRYVLLLHDDDFLLPAALAAIVEAVDSCAHPPEVLLFGVDVIGAGGRRRRRQSVRRRHHLPPERALVALLGDSSFVRFPGMVVSRAAYRAVPPFDEEIGEVADVFMWARLLAAHGLRREPAVTAAYRVHAGALTTGMWRPEVVRAAARVFDDDAVSALLADRRRHRLQARWMSQFVLAGAWRRLRAGDAAGALTVLELLDSSAARGAEAPVSRRAGRRALAAVAEAGRRGRGSAPHGAVLPCSTAVLLERPADGGGSEPGSLEESPAPSGDGDTIPGGQGGQHSEHADGDSCHAAGGGA